MVSVAHYTDTRHEGVAAVYEAYEGVAAVPLPPGVNTYM